MVELITDPEEKRTPSRLLIGLALVVVVVALLIISQVFPALYGLVFIPDAPLPTGVSQTTHTNITYGVDVWTYTSSENPCELANFYIENDSTCELATGLCSGTTYNDPGYAIEAIATCTGTDTYSIYGLRWEVDIYNQRLDGELTTTFDLQREMLWAGPAPAMTSTPPAS